MSKAPKKPAKTKAKPPKRVASKAEDKARKSASKPVRKVARKAAQLDEELTLTAAQARHHPVTRAVAKLTELADQPPLIAASLGTLAIGLVAGRPDLARGGARMLASHLLATGAKLAVKQGVARTRPGPALDKGEAKFALGESGEHDETSFPSGHTAGAVAVARAASREIEGAAAPGAVATAAVAAAQAPAGNHYLSDVIAGAVIGWASEAVVSAVFDRLETKEGGILPNPSLQGEGDRPL
jgi:membrane-associated phospholipid phosphatase